VAQRTQKQDLDCPATYVIEVQGWLDESWSDWFDGMDVVPQVSAEGKTITKLTGGVIDQAALLGLLRRLHNLHLRLLSVNRVE
jgi:hypothetical protein